jgi:septal ring factor EnvC (AmiA/AmiB activator)
MATHTYNYVSSSKNWTSELAIVFGAGFLAASLLWLGVWFFQARPAQASALEAQGSELQETQQALAQCQTSVGLLTEDKAMLETEVKQLDTMLKNAWAAASRKAANPGATGVALKADN